MKKKYEVKLSDKDKKHLESIIKAGKEKARTITRSRILLLSDQNWLNVDICDALSITMKTIQNVCGRYINDGLESALYEKARSGRPEIFNGKERANITALACSKPPEGYSQWSLRLLADKAIELNFVDDISHTEISTILKKMRSNPISKGNGVLAKSRQRLLHRWKKS